VNPLVVSALHQSGQPPKEIARLLDVSVTTVYRAMSRPPRVATREDALMLREAGMSYRAMGTVFSCHHTTIMRWLT
jgi:hypothetical protein